MVRQSRGLKKKQDKNIILLFHKECTLQNQNVTDAMFLNKLESKNKNAKVIGVELRPELVKKCSDVAEKCAYKNLSFLSKISENSWVFVVNKK